MQETREENAFAARQRLYQDGLQVGQTSSHLTPVALTPERRRRRGHNILCAALPGQGGMGR